MGNCVVDGEAPISSESTASNYTSLSALLCERQHSLPAVDSVPAEVDSAQILQSVLEANPAPAELRAAISISAAPLRDFFASPSDQLSLAVRDWLGLTFESTLPRTCVSALFPPIVVASNSSFVH